MSLYLQFQRYINRSFPLILNIPSVCLVWEGSHGASVLEQVPKGLPSLWSYSHCGWSIGVLFFHFSWLGVIPAIITRWSFVFSSFSYISFFFSYSNLFLRSILSHPYPECPIHAWCLMRSAPVSSLTGEMPIQHLELADEGSTGWVFKLWVTSHLPCTQ